MPKVKHYSALWLSGDAPGHQVFAPSTDLQSHYSSKNKKAPAGPRRTIARRGTEAFVAVGREIRWADLVYVRDDWVAKQGCARSGSGYGSGTRIKQEDSVPSIENNLDQGEHAGGFRTLKTPVADDIRQLVISPNGQHLAILTAYTVHICLIPDSSHLTSEDTGPMRPKILTLGPTTHVTSRSPVMSALWHPLGVNGCCIVTVTADAIVRLWELSTNDRWSYDSPSTSVDLKKLADGITLDQDSTAHSAATNKAFSPDSFEMEVAAASFASRGSGDWSPMTLWVAMREGDVYALCPLLPQRWAPPPTLIPSLSVSIVTTVASLEDDPNVDDGEELLAQQQLQWMGDLDAQEPQLIDGLAGEAPTEVYARPSRPGATPRLQGPFNLIANPDSGDDLDTTITDILVIGKRTDTDALMMGEDEDLDIGEGDQEGSSLTVVCLLSTSGQVRVYLDLDGVEAQWLPPRNRFKWARLPAPPGPSLLTFQAMDSMSPVEISEESWPLFSTDVTSRYNFFVTNHAAITFFSLASWIFRLEGELNGNHKAGTDFRIGLLVNSQSGRDRIYAQPAPEAAVVPLAACVAIRDPDLGYFLLSATPWDPVALTFETPDVDLLEPARRDSSPMEREGSSKAPLDFYQPRPVFNPPHAFDEPSALPGLVDKLRTSRHKTIVNQEVKLSPLTLQIFTDAHKVLGDETYQLGMAAAELFRRCDQLQDELRQQICKANEVKGKVDSISGAHRSDHEPDNAAYERRAAEARQRQDRLEERVDGLRRLVGRASTRNLSVKERAFVDEVKALDAALDGHGASNGGGGGDGGSGQDNGYVGGEKSRHQPQQQQQQQQSQTQGKQPWMRLQELKNLQTELREEAGSLARAGLISVGNSSSVSGNGNDRMTAGNNSGSSSTVTAAPTSATEDMRIPQEVRRSRIRQVQGLLSRETALVEALTSRLERLRAEA